MRQTEEQIERIKWAKDKICRLYDDVTYQCNGHQNKIITDMNLDDLMHLAGLFLEIYMTFDKPNQWSDRCKTAYKVLENKIYKTLLEMRGTHGKTKE